MIRTDWPLSRIAALGLLFSLLPVSSAAEAIELTQSQIRQLVAQERMMSAEAIIHAARGDTDASVLEIRGYEDSGTLSYRVVLQCKNGVVSTHFLDAQTGEKLPPAAAVVMSKRKATRGPSSRPN